MSKHAMTTRRALASTPSSSTKLPFRPRKIRKVSAAKSADTSTAGPPPQALSIAPILIPPPILKPLSFDGEIDAALRHLGSSDSSLSPLIASLNRPIFESSSRPFLSLAKSILYQQLATKAAKTIYLRFIALFAGGEAAVSPDTVLALSASELRQVGVSGRKASYLHDLADKYKNGVLSDPSILEMDDEALLRVLTTVKGIGVWSVHMFMMFSLHRPDVLPVGDLGVRKGVQLLFGLKELPKPVEMEQLCEKWRPYRSVGSWYMWRLIESKGTPKVPATPINSTAI